MNFKNKLMNLRQELIRYAKWYDRNTMPEDAQTSEDDLVGNVDSYLQTQMKDVINDEKENLTDAKCNHDWHTFFNKGYRKCNKCGNEYIL